MISNNKDCVRTLLVLARQTKNYTCENNFSFEMDVNELTDALDNVHITANKNAIPFDPLPPTITSGIRLGTPAGTTRGFGVKEFELIGNAIADVAEALNTENEKMVLNDVTARILKLTAQFPIYQD